MAWWSANGIVHTKDNTQHTKSCTSIHTTNRVHAQNFGCSSGPRTNASNLYSWSTRFKSLSRLYMSEFSAFSKYLQSCRKSALNHTKTAPFHMPSSSLFTYYPPIIQRSESRLLRASSYNLPTYNGIIIILLLLLLLFPDWTGPNTHISDTLYLLMKYGVKKYGLMSTKRNVA